MTPAYRAANRLSSSLTMSPTALVSGCGPIPGWYTAPVRALAAWGRRASMRLDGDGDVIDQLLEFQKGPRFRLCRLKSVNQRCLVGEVASIASRIFDAATAGSRRTSLSQTRTTVQPSARRTRATCRSRWRFRSIFATQYDAFQPSASLPFLVDHLRPCQKSPSQKTTTRCLAITKSGRPSNAGGCKSIPNAGGPKSLSQEDLRSGILTTIAGPNAARLCAARTKVLVAGHRQRGLPGRHECSAGCATCTAERRRLSAHGRA